MCKCFRKSQIRIINFGNNCQIPVIYEGENVSLTKDCDNAPGNSDTSELMS